MQDVYRMSKHCIDFNSTEVYGPKLVTESSVYKHCPKFADMTTNDQREDNQFKNFETLCIIMKILI